MSLSKNHILIIFMFLVSLLMLFQVLTFDSSFEIPKSNTVSVNKQKIDFPDPVLNLEEYKGKVIFLNFWATWCPSCDLEMPSIEALKNKFTESELVVLTISIDENQDVVDKYLLENNFSFPVILDPNNTIGSRLGVSAFPESHIINKDGITIQKIVGARDWASEDYVAAFQELVSGPTLMN